jgi:hypothetical protein
MTLKPAKTNILTLLLPTLSVLPCDITETEFAPFIDLDDSVQSIKTDRQPFVHLRMLESFGCDLSKHANKLLASLCENVYDTDDAALEYIMRNYIDDLHEMDLEDILGNYYTGDGDLKDIANIEAACIMCIDHRAFDKLRKIFRFDGICISVRSSARVLGRLCSIDTLQYDLSTEDRIGQAIAFVYREITRAWGAGIIINPSVVIKLMFEMAGSAMSEYGFVWMAKQLSSAEMHNHYVSDWMTVAPRGGWLIAGRHRLYDNRLILLYLTYYYSGTGHDLVCCTELINAIYIQQFDELMDIASHFGNGFPIENIMTVVQLCCAKNSAQDIITLAINSRLGDKIITGIIACLRRYDRHDLMCDFRAGIWQRFRSVRRASIDQYFGDSYEEALTDDALAIMFDSCAPGGYGVFPIYIRYSRISRNFFDVGAVKKQVEQLSPSIVFATHISSSSSGALRSLRVDFELSVLVRLCNVWPSICAEVRRHVL